MDAASAQATRAVPDIPCDAEGPVFREPWEAQAFAMALALHERGVFTWTEWAETLGAELRESAARGEPDDGSHYYHCWLAALERLVVDKGLSDATALLARKEAWVEAYRRTPHGQPVQLDGDLTVKRRVR